MTQPGEGTVTPPAGDAGGAVTTPGAAPQLDPNNLPPEVLAVVNARIQKDADGIRSAERERVKAELAAEQKRQEMTDAQRLQADLTARDARIAELEGKATVATRTADLVARSGGKVSAALAEKVVTAFQGDWNVDKALEDGLAQAKSLLQAWGFNPDAPAPAPTFQPQGGGPLPSDKSKWTDEQIAEAVRGGQIKLDEANRLWDMKAAGAP